MVSRTSHPSHWEATLRGYPSCDVAILTYPKRLAILHFKVLFGLFLPAAAMVVLFLVIDVGEFIG